ncbi:MAG: Yip1 family protein [Steroidobacteraceae bacterium]
MSELIGRVQRILLTPKTEWPAIAAEPATTTGIYKGYIAILAAIGPIAMFIKSTLIGYQMPFVGSYRADIGDGIVALVVSYVLSLVATYVFALIVNALAPTFGGQKDSLLALKAAAYAMTASWLAGIAQILPIIGMLIMLAGGIYSIYLLYLGLPVTMKSPPEKAAGYTAVSVICAILLFWIVGAVVGGVMGQSIWGGYGGWRGGPSVTDSGSLDKDSTLGKLEQWGKDMEAAGKQVEQSAEQQNGVPTSAAVGQLMGAMVGAKAGGEALPVEQIKKFLPETLAGLPRTSISAERNAAMGFEVSEANAEYSDGAGRSLRLSLDDTGGAQGFLALANWAQVEQEREWDGGYERSYRQDGRMVHESWNKSSGSGEYGLIVGQRFAIEVEGAASGIDELRAAVGAGVDVAGLEAIAAQQKAAN